MCLVRGAIGAAAAVGLAAVAGCGPTANAPAAPTAAAPVAAAAPATGPVLIEVPLEPDHGTFQVPVILNNSLQVKATLDSGASDVVIPAEVAQELVHGGTIAQGDYVGERVYVLADGSRIPSRVINLRSLKVGTLELTNVRAAVGGSGSSLLLGQSFLSRLTHWSIDNRRHVLVLNDTLDADAHITTPVTAPGVAPPKTTMLPPGAPDTDRKPFGGDADDGDGGGRGDADEAPARPGGKTRSEDGGKKW